MTDTPREIKRMDIREFREQGFLQEANRLFFHPHGLALELTVVTVNDDAPAPLYTLALPAAQYKRLRALADADADLTDDADLLERLDAAKRYDVGDMYLSGIWDDRNDPEGVLFGDLTTCHGGHLGREHAERVHTERARHAVHRAQMFSKSDDDLNPDPDLIVRHDLDIEPLDYVWTEAPTSLDDLEEERQEQLAAETRDATRPANDA